MSLAKFEKDLENVKKQVAQVAAQYNMLMGQQATLEHVIAELKNPAPEAAVEGVGEIVN